MQFKIVPPPPKPKLSFYQLKVGDFFILFGNLSNDIYMKTHNNSYIMVFSNQPREDFAYREFSIKNKLWANSIDKVEFQYPISIS